MFFIESENYRIANCIAEITFGCLFGLFSILAFFEFFPLDTLIFFLIPSVFILGWVFMKIDVTPEKLSLKADSFEYYRGNKKIFAQDPNEIKKISWDEGGISQTLYDKRLIVYFIDDSECSYPYRYFSDGKLKEMEKKINEYYSNKT